MANLPVEHPDVHWNFMEGHFSMHLSGESPFGEDSRGSDHGGNCQQRHKDERDRDNIQLEDRRCKQILLSGRVQVCFSRTAQGFITSKATSFSPR